MLINLPAAQLGVRSIMWPGVMVLVALCALYVPTVISLSNSLWLDSTHSHGPIVLAVVVWLFARGLRWNLASLPQNHDTTAESARRLKLAIAPLLLGGVLYVVGRSQSLYIFEVGSAIPVLLGLVLLTFGPQMARKLWFPMVFILFMVPLPGSFIDSITHPLKLGVSWTSEHLLLLMDYPVARSGVILSVGPYQMFVADACAGLTSLFMLEAFGLLYLNVVRHASAVRNVILAILIVPISFISNVVRVIMLCLITFHFGDAAGQGFMHDFSGMVLFAAALALTVAADTGARTVARRFQRHKGQQPSNDDDGASSPGLWPAVASWAPLTLTARAASILLVAAAASLAMSSLLTPRPVAAAGAGDLEKLIPREFGEWTMVDRPLIPIDVLANEPGETTLHSPYDQTVMRVYRHRDGTVVDLAVAYGKHQRQEVKIHQPELCFNSQGFRVKSRSATEFQRAADQPGPAVTGYNLLSESQSVKLAASYWIRIGKIYADSAWETRWEIFREGMRGRAVDGVLVRATTRVMRQDETDQAHRVMESFLSELLAKGSPELRRALAP